MKPPFDDPALEDLRAKEESGKVRFDLFAADSGCPTLLVLDRSGEAWHGLRYCRVGDGPWVFSDEHESLTLEPAVRWLCAAAGDLLSRASARVDSLFASYDELASRIDQ